MAAAIAAAAPLARAQGWDEEDEEPFALPPGFGRVEDPRTDRKEANRILIPTSHRLDVEWKRAEAAAASGDFATACRKLVEILSIERDPSTGKQRVAPAGSNRHLSYTRLIRERLYAFPEEGRRAYRALADGEARALYARALEDGPDGRRALDLIWRTYPLASCADDALERLGDYALEAGQAALALDRYERAARLPGGDLDLKRLETKAAAARALLAAAGAAGRADPGGGGPTAWPVVGGRNDHAAPLPPLGAIPLQPRYSKPMPPSRAASTWGLRAGRGVQRRFDGLQIGRDVEAFAESIPVAAEGKLVLVTGRAAVCYRLETGERLWYQAPWAGKEHEDNPHIFYAATIASGRVFAPFIDRISHAEYYREIPIVEDIPHRRLVAFDLETGKRLWDHADSPEKFLRDASVALPPIERDGLLFAQATIRDGPIRTYLIAVDAPTGKLLWKRFLGAGQVELTMFGEHAVEAPVMMPAEHAGTVYACNAFGVLAAVSAHSGELEWLATYETIELEAAQTYYARKRQLLWKNSPPVVRDGIVVVAPVDSEKAYGYDAATGELRWAINHETERRLLGAIGSTAVFQGDRIRGIDVRTGKLVAAYPKIGAPGAAGLGEEETGRGLICGREVVIPQASRILKIDLPAGERTQELPIAGGVRDSGTLLFVGGDLVTVNPQRACVFSVTSPRAAVDPDRDREGAAERSR